MIIRRLRGSLGYGSRKHQGGNGSQSHEPRFLLCQTFFFALFLRRLTPRRRGSVFGSPVAAFFTLPPSSSAISVSVRLVNTENGSVSAMSSSFAYLSRCLIRSHWRSRVRTSTNEPFNFWPSKANLSSPFAIALETLVVFSGP